MKFLEIEKADIIRVTQHISSEKNDNVVIRLITEENILDGMTFNDENEIDTFRTFLKKGHKGYYAYYNGQCALRTWIFFDKDKCLVGKNFIYDLPSNEAFSGWSKTNPQFLRLGIFTSALDYAIKDNSHKIISGYVESSNIGSLKGTRKVGFETMEKYILILFLGYGIKIRTFQFGKGKSFVPSIGRTIKPL